MAAIAFLVVFGTWFFDNNPVFRFWESPSQLFVRAEQLLQNAENKKGAEYLVQADRRARDDCSGEERLNLRLQIRETYEAHRDALEEMNTYNYFNMDDIISSALREEECEELLKALGLKYEVVDGLVWAHSEDNRYYTNLRQTGSLMLNEYMAKLGFWRNPRAQIGSTGKSGLFDEKGYCYAKAEGSCWSCWDLYGNEQELIDTEIGAELIGLEDGHLYYSEGFSEDGAIYRTSIEATQQGEEEIRRQKLVPECVDHRGAALLDGYLYYVKNVAEGEGYAGRLFRCLSDGKQEEQITGDLPLQYVSTGEVVKWEDQDIDTIFSADGGMMIALDNGWNNCIYIKYRPSGEATVYCTDGYSWSSTYSDNTGFYHVGYKKDDGEETEKTYKLCRTVRGSNHCETLRSDIGKTESVLYHNGDWVVVEKDRQMLKVINIFTGTMGEISIPEEEGEFDDSCAIVDDTLFCSIVVENDLESSYHVSRVNLEQISEGITELSLENCPEENDFGYPCFLGEARENGKSYCLYARRGEIVRRLKAY